MKKNLAIIALSILLILSIGLNLTMMLVVNDEVNAQREMIGCMSVFDGKSSEEVDLAEISKTFGNCISTHTTINKY